MHIRKLLVALLMTFSLSAAAEFISVEAPYEISLKNLTTPVTNTGSLIFKECDECDTLMFRMTTNTQFIIGGRTVDLKEFRKLVFQVRDPGNVPVTVLRNLESNTIVSVNVGL